MPKGTARFIFCPAVCYNEKNGSLQKRRKQGQMKKVGITACSNAQMEEYRSQNVELAGYLRSLDILPVTE